jgi:acetyl-CoA acetyltransferase
MAYMHRALGLKKTKYWQAMGIGPGPMCSIVGAIHAMIAGAASTVICYRSHVRQEQTRYFIPGVSDIQRASGEVAFRAPFGVPASAPRFAIWAQRHAYEFGTTDEHRGAVVLTCREHAQLNPSAIWKGTTLTMDEYLASDVTASPLRVLDCDMPVDGAVAVILTMADRVADIRGRPVYVESLGCAAGPTLEADAWPDMSYMASKFVAEQLWSGTSLEPADVDVAEVYDGFSSLAICWLEDMGFVKKGEAGPFLLEGRGRIGSDLPICTDGGQLGAGRIHGLRQLAEATLQLRGECHEHQVAGAEVAVACVGGGPSGVALLLTV